MSSHSRKPWSLTAIGNGCYIMCKLLPDYLLYTAYTDIHVYFSVACKRAFFLFKVKTWPFYLEHYLHCFFSFFKWLKIAKIICIIIWFWEFKSGVISQCNTPHKRQGKRKVRRWVTQHTRFLWIHGYCIKTSAQSLRRNEYDTTKLLKQWVMKIITRCLVEDLRAGN